MRHSTITMTMDTYGTVFDEEMNSASLKVAQLAFHGDRAQDGAQSLKMNGKMVGAIGFEL